MSYLVQLEFFLVLLGKTFEARIINTLSTAAGKSLSWVMFNLNFSWSLWENIFEIRHQNTFPIAAGKSLDWVMLAIKFFLFLQLETKMLFPWKVYNIS